MRTVHVALIIALITTVAAFLTGHETIGAVATVIAFASAFVAVLEVNTP